MKSFIIRKLVCATGICQCLFVCGKAVKYFIITQK